MIDKNSADIRHNNILKFAALVPIIVSALLIILKVYGWSVTGSLSIFSSLVDSFLDILISAINLVAIFYALKPADHDHRFGHDAVEDIAGLAQAAFILGAALIILIQGVNNVFAPDVLEHSETGIKIMFIVIAVTFALVLFQKFVSRKTGSIVVAADSVHYEADVLMNLSIIAALYFNTQHADTILAILIALYISRSAVQIGKKSFDNLMAKEIDDEMKKKILKIIKKQKEIKGFHELKTRASGRKIFVQMHVEIKKDLSLAQTHAISEKLEDDLRNAFEQIEVIIHHDPV